MSMTITAVSSTATRIGSGRAGSVTIRVPATSRPTVSTVIWSPFGANVDPDTVAAQPRGLTGEIAGMDELGKRLASARRLAGAQFLVEHKGIADAADHARRVQVK